MADLPCPQWENPEPADKLPSIVKNAEPIYEFIRRQNPKRYLLDHGDLKNWHGKLFKDAVPVPYYAGNYRCSEQRYPCLSQDVVVKDSSGAVLARGVPFREVPERMTAFSAKMTAATIETDRFVDGQRSDVAKLKAALQLAAFVAGSIIQIHPFLNGNGRTARLASNFFLHRYGYGMPFFVARPRGIEYVAASHAAMNSGDFIPLYRYFLTLVAT